MTAVPAVMARSGVYGAAVIADPVSIFVGIVPVSASGSAVVANPVPVFIGVVSASADPVRIQTADGLPAISIPSAMPMGGGRDSQSGGGKGKSGQRDKHFLLHNRFLLRVGLQTGEVLPFRL